MAMKETMDLFDFVQALAKAKIEAMRDDKIDWRDSPKMVPVIAAAFAAFKGSEKIKGEWESPSKEDMEAFAAKALETLELCREAILA